MRTLITGASSGLGAGMVAMADAVERAPAFAYVPTWPWSQLGRVLRVMPTPVLRRVT